MKRHAIETAWREYATLHFTSLAPLPDTVVDFVQQLFEQHTKDESDFQPSVHDVRILLNRLDKFKRDDHATVVDEWIDEVRDCD